MLWKRYGIEIMENESENPEFKKGIYRPRVPYNPLNFNEIDLLNQ